MAVGRQYWLGERIKIPVVFLYDPNVPSHYRDYERRRKTNDVREEEDFIYKHQFSDLTCVGRFQRNEIVTEWIDGACNWRKPTSRSGTLIKEWEGSTSGETRRKRHRKLKENRRKPYWKPNVAIDTKRNLTYVKMWQGGGIVRVSYYDL